MLIAERGYERFDQIVDLKKSPPLAFNRPRVDFSSDEIFLDNPIEAPYVQSYVDGSGFLSCDLNPETGLPMRFVTKPFAIQEVFKLTAWWTLDEKILEKGWDKALATPMFRARDGMDSLFVEPYLNVDTAMQRYGVRECFFATPENLQKLRERIITQDIKN